MFEKLKSKISTAKGKIACSVGAGVATLGSAMTAFAAETGTNTEAVSAAKALMDAATATLNIGNVVAILSAGIGAVLGMFLSWWGARKLVNMLIKVFKKGKISL